VTNDVASSHELYSELARDEPSDKLTVFTGEADGEGNADDQTPPRSKSTSTSEPVRDGVGELLESRKVVIGTSGSAVSTRGVWANRRMVFMNEFMVN